MKRCLYSLLLLVLFQIQLKAQITISTTNACQGLCNGTALVNDPIIGHTYLWNDGDTSTHHTGLCAGTVDTLSVDSGIAHIATLYVSIIQDNLAAMANLNPTLYSCTNGRLGAWPTALYGTGPYTYSWIPTTGLDSSNVSNPTVSGITNTTVYTVTVTDANGCTAIAQDTAYRIPTLTLVGITTVQPTCGQNNGSITAQVTGGLLPYRYYWSISYPLDSSRLPNLGGFVYNFHVYDAANCFTNTVYDTLSASAAVQVTLTPVQPTCGTYDGSITAVVTGGVPPYRYYWNGALGTSTLANAGAGIYNLSVHDSGICAGTASDTLVGFDPHFYVFLNSTSANCANNGSVVAQVNGGTPPYQFSWSNGHTGDSIAGLAGGTYSLTVTDTIGCGTTGHSAVSNNCGNVITGTIWHDTNGNCVKDSAEQGFATGCFAIPLHSGSIFMANSGTDGKYAIPVSDTGSYWIYFGSYDPNCVSLETCSGSDTVTFTGSGDTSANHNFGVPVSSGPDLGMHAGWRGADSSSYLGLDSISFLLMGYVENDYPITVDTLTLTYDDTLTFLSTNTPFLTHNPLTHTITWIQNNPPHYYFDWNNRIISYFSLPHPLDTNYSFHVCYAIYPIAGDCNPHDNTDCEIVPYKSSHDPNAKRVEPAGQLSDNDSVLTYTIYYQNTGTATTHFVVVSDTLSPYLDPRTVVNLASSAPYDKFDISGKGVLTWTYSPYYLPDSMSDSKKSMGFIRFSVRRYMDASAGQSISNKAYVYFDYNNPVITNTVTDTIANTVVTSIATLRQNSSVSVKAFPNPFNGFTNIVVAGINQKYGFELYDVTGRLQQTIPSLNTNQFVVSRAGLANGVYFYRIIQNNTQVAVGKLVVE